MNYYDQQKMKRIRSIDRSLKEIAFFLHVIAEQMTGEEPELPKTACTNAVGFEVTKDDDCE